MGIEIWNKNAKEGKIALAKEQTERVKAEYRKDIDIQNSKSNAIVAVARIIGDIASIFISSKKKE